MADLTHIFCQWVQPGRLILVESKRVAHSETGCVICIKVEAFYQYIGNLSKFIQSLLE